MSSGRKRERNSTDPDADIDAAMELIRMLGQAGGFHEALEALGRLSPLVLAMVIGSLVSRRFFTVPCPACGHPVEHEHDPVRFAYPRRLVAGGSVQADEGARGPEGNP